MKIRTFGYCLIAVAILLLFASVNSHAATPLPIGKTQIGGTVKLAPGSYDFYVNNITGPYTVEGGPGVVVNSMTVNNSSGLTFKNISFSTLSLW